jgi:hypothetical protein
MQRFVQDALLRSIFFSVIVLILMGCTSTRPQYGFVCKYEEAAPDTFNMEEAIRESAERSGPMEVGPLSATNCEYGKIGEVPDTTESDAPVGADCYPVTEIGPDGSTYTTYTCY